MFDVDVVAAKDEWKNKSRSEEHSWLYESIIMLLTWVYNNNNRNNNGDEKDDDHHHHMKSNSNSNCKLGS